MARLTPNSQFTAYLYAVSLRWANQPHLADSVLRRLDANSGELRGRIYFPHHYAGVLHVLGDHERELSVTRAAIAQYPRRLFISIENICALIALGKLAEADHAIDAMFTLAPDLRGSALYFGAIAVYEMRWHGHAAQAAALGEKLLLRMNTLPRADGDSSSQWWDARGRLELRAAMHRWPTLDSSTARIVATDPANIVALRWRGVALAMQGQRALALRVDSTLAAATAPERRADLCILGARGACRRVARAYIAAALGDRARAVSLLDFRTFNDWSAHYDLIGEWLRDYPPFQEFIKPKG